MKVTISACLAGLGMASAFVTPATLRPAASLQQSKASTSTPVMSAVDDWIGVSYETGDVVFDPLGLAELHSVAPQVQPHPKWLREAEIKHCRICMLAFVGILCAQSGVVWPGLGYEAVPWYDQFGEFATKNPFGLVQILLFIGAVEGYFYPGEFWSGGGDREAGDMGFYFRLVQENKLKEMKLQELKNGRLAMISVAACASEHWITGAVPALTGQGY